MNQDTTNEDGSEDSEDDIPTSKSISKKRKILPSSSDDEDFNNNPAKHGQHESPLPLDDEEEMLNDLLGENNNNNVDVDFQVNDVNFQVNNKDSNPPGLDDGGLDENMATQETSNSSAVLEDNGVYSSLSPTLIIY